MASQKNKITSLPKLYLTFGIVFAIAFNVFAQHDNTLNEQKVINSALLHYPKIYSAEEQLKIAQQNLRQSKGEFDAKFESKYNQFSSGYYDGNGYSSSQIVKPLEFSNAKVYGGYVSSLNGQDPQQNQYYNTKNGGRSIFGFEVSLLRGLLINEQNAGIKIAKTSVEISNHANNLLKKQVIVDAKKAFWKFVYAKQVLKCYENLLDVAIKRNEAIEKQVKLGDKAQIVLTENQRAILRRRSQLETARREFLNAAVSLSIYLRDDNGEMLNYDLITKLDLQYVEPTMPLPEKVSESAIIASQERIDIRINELMLQQADIKVKLAKNDVLPTLDIGAETLQDYGKGQSTKDKRADKIKINLSIPIENNKQRGKLGKQEAELKKLKYDLKFLQNQIQNNVLSLHNSFKEVYNIVKNSSEEEKIAKQLVKAEEIRFFNGDSDFFMLNAREQDLVFIQEYLIKNKFSLVELNLEYNFSTKDTLINKDSKEIN